MKAWGWIIVGLAWMSVAISGRFGFAITVSPNRWITEQVALATDLFIFRLIQFGWILPIAVGIVQISRRRPTLHPPD